LKKFLKVNNLSTKSLKYLIQKYLDYQKHWHNLMKKANQRPSNWNLRMKKNTSTLSVASACYTTQMTILQSTSNVTSMNASSSNYASLTLLHSIWRARVKRIWMKWTRTTSNLIASNAIVGRSTSTAKAKLTINSYLPWTWTELFLIRFTLMMI
jgi:hypothetical protein